MSRRKILLLLLAGFGAVALLLALAQPLWREWDLARTCRGADRVVLDLNVIPSPQRDVVEFPTLQVYTVDGAQAVEELLKALMLRPTVPGWRCRCYGDVVFRIQRQNRTLAEVSYHHHGHLRWRDGRWLGDAPLTAASKAALAKWLRQHGCPSVDEMSEAVD